MEKAVNQLPSAKKWRQWLQIEWHFVSHTKVWKKECKKKITLIIYKTKTSNGALCVPPKFLFCYFQEFFKYTLFNRNRPGCIGALSKNQILQVIIFTILCTIDYKTFSMFMWFFSCNFLFNFPIFARSKEFLTKMARYFMIKNWLSIY